MITAIVGQMTLIMGKHRVPVSSFAKTSEIFEAAHDHFGVGGSETPTPELADASGQIIAHVSSNGRVWPEGKCSWAPGAAPLYRFS